MQIPKKKVKSSQKDFGFLKISGGIKRKYWSKTRQKIKKIHLTLWCGNFVQTHSFPIVSGDSSKTLRKLCVSAKILHQEIR